MLKGVRDILVCQLKEIKQDLFFCCSVTSNLFCYYSIIMHQFHL
jgi:hypothetical protein